METQPTEQTFPLREAQKLVRDLMKPTPWIYWFDFIFHVSLGWAAFALVLLEPFFSMVQLAAFIVAVLALYRSAIFIHELTHLKKGTFKLFRIVWNVFCGIPLMIPSFTYDGVHNNHHKPDIYGTAKDGEYLPFATQKPAAMMNYVLLSVFMPILTVFRFLLLAPLSYLIPPLRKVVWERASSMIINPNYKRDKNDIRNDFNWRLQEQAAFLLSALVVIGVGMEIISYQFLILWYAVTASVFLLNSLRTLAAHAYRNPASHKMSFTEQYLDSINVPGNRFFTALWAPVGLRYHATHHLFMGMPYHNLGEAQRRLVNGLEDNSLYIRTSRNSLKDALTRIWHESSATR